MEPQGQLTNRVAALREEMRWSQQELAEKVGVSRQTIAALEANRYAPSLKRAFVIARAFSKSIDEVFQFVAEDEWY